MFGMVPAALMGVDIVKLLETAKKAAETFGPEAEMKNNAALQLGAFMGASYANHSKDKLTILAPKELAAFGLWAEQLVAESTGKEGKGVVPVVGEGIALHFDYREDRIFVHISLDTEDDKRVRGVTADLAERGYPVMTITMNDVYELGAQFLLWEIATAAAGAIMAINPFDQPNVQAAKTLTKQILKTLDRKSVV